MPSVTTGAAMAADLKRTAHAVRMRRDQMPAEERRRYLIRFTYKVDGGGERARYQLPALVNPHAVATSTGRRARVRVRRTGSPKAQVPGQSMKHGKAA